MAYNEKTKRTDSTNCAEHAWGRNGSKLVSTGVVRQHRCNNCLALKITFQSDFFIDGEWISKEDTQIIEPNWSK